MFHPGCGAGGCSVENRCLVSAESSAVVCAVARTTPPGIHSVAAGCGAVLGAGGAGGAGVAAGGLGAGGTAALAVCCRVARYGWLDGATGYGWPDGAAGYGGATVVPEGCGPAWCCSAYGPGYDGMPGAAYGSATGEPATGDVGGRPTLHWPMGMVWLVNTVWPVGTALPVAGGSTGLVGGSAGPAGGAAGGGSGAASEPGLHGPLGDSRSVTAGTSWISASLLIDSSRAFPARFPYPPLRCLNPRGNSIDAVRPSLTRPVRIGSPGLVATPRRKRRTVGNSRHPGDERS